MRHSGVAMAAALALGGCAAGAMDRAPAKMGISCGANVRSVGSPPGKVWMREQGWRFASHEQAAAEYAKLVDEASPWPDWIRPVPSTLPVGTRYQMAIGGGQTPEQPGAFGTFDHLDELDDVRDGLAVRTEWKPSVDRFVTYEVTRPLPVFVGPVGPQVDPRSCRLLPGRWSQLQLLAEPMERMQFLRVVEVRPAR